MPHDQGQVGIVFTAFFSVLDGAGAHVEVVRHAAPLYGRKPGDARHGNHFVHGHRVIDIRLYAHHVRYALGQKGPKVRGVFPSGGAAQIVQHVIVNQVGPGFEGRQKPTPAHHHIQAGEGRMVLFKRGQYGLKPEQILVGDGVVAGLIFTGMRDALHKYWRAVIVYRDLGACGAGVDGEYQRHEIPRCLIGHIREGRPATGWSARTRSADSRVRCRALTETRCLIRAL